MQILEGLNRKVLWYFLDITYQVGDWLRAQWIFRHSKTITTNDNHMFENGESLKGASGAWEGLRSKFL